MFIELCKAVILGVVEGITEFLPISSTGHLIIVNQLISFDREFTVLFDVVIQLGAILAVVVVFWQKLWPFTWDGVGKKIVLRIDVLRLWLKVMVAVVPALIVGALYGNIIEERLFNPFVVAGALVVGGAVLIYIEKKSINSSITDVKNVTYRTAFIVGLFQCIGMIPGTSRAAATIVGAMLLGIARAAAVEFSFFLAIPTMVAASGYSLLKYGWQGGVWQGVVLVAGFFTSFVVALVVIKFFLQFVQRRDFKVFGWYRIVLGATIVIFSLFNFIR